jgi:xyloglucan-specific exo-beta-1,4-glucanase
MKKIEKAFILMLLLCVAAAVDIAAQTTQTYTWKNVQIVGGGFVPGIIYNRSESGLVYARTDIGGAYRLDRSSGLWVPLLDSIGWDDWNLTGVLSLATDAKDPKRLYLACGSYTNSWDPYNGAILRSADYGATWAKTAMPFKIGGNMPGRGCGERLAIDPNNNAILFFGASGDKTKAYGLWKSTDYGVTWSQVTSFPNPGTYIEDSTDTYDYLTSIQGIYWVVFDESTGTSGSATQTIYVGVGDKNGNCIYRSTNGGSTWALVPGQPVQYTLACPHQAQLDSVNHYLYITYSNNGGPYAGSMGDVYRLNTATDALTCVSPVVNNGTGSGDCYFGYAGLSIDRQKPTTLMVTGYSSWWPDTIIWRSTDSGATWTKIWDWGANNSRTLRYTLDITAAPWLNWGETAPQAPLLSPQLGWMTEALAINPFNSNEMMYGTGATLFGTTNLTNWDSGGQISISVKAMGIEETSVQVVLSPPSGASLISSLGDIYGFRHDSLTTPPAAFFMNPRDTASSMDFAELKPSFIYRVVKGGDTVDYVTQQYSGYSNDGGTTWIMNWNSPSGTTDGGVVAVGSDGMNVVWSPVGATTSYSPQSGSYWNASTGIPNESVVASDRVNPKKFYGFKAGTFYVSTDGGATFASTAASGFPTTVAVCIKAVPGVEGDVWVAGGASVNDVYGMWHSTDSGASFTKLANVDQADVVGFGKALSGTYPAVYTSAKIGGVRGIYRSDDAGATWVRINDDQHQWGWTGKTITGDPRVAGRVYIGTNGRGIIYGDASGSVGTAAPTAVPTAAPTTGPTAAPTAVPTIAPTAVPTVIPPIGPTALPTTVPTTVPTTAPGGLPGDVNSTGTVDIVDALLVAQYYVGLNPSGFVSANADVNCSGAIDIVDALVIAQYYVGLIASFPC